MSLDNSMDRLFLSMENRSNFDDIVKILLIGETGAGKSTVINYLYNYFHQGDLNNLKIAIPSKYHPFPTEQFAHNEFNIQDNTQSKTNICTQYMFTDSITNKQYLFLDTPGLSDTRGLEQDEMNINKIVDAITQLGNLTAVFIVVNGSTSRLTSNLRSVIAYLNGNIPDIVLENVIVILTNVKKHESPFDLKILNLHGKVYPFYMQNGAFVSDPQTWMKSIRDELQFDWIHSMNQIKFILQIINTFKQVSTNAFIQMKQIRNEIKLILHQARLEMIQIQQIQDQLSQLELAFQRAGRDTINYQDYTRGQTVEKIQIIDAPYHSTLCAVCNQVCHNNCRLNETTLVGAQIFLQCSVMLNGKCQQCRNHCSYINHYHAKKSILITHETLHDIFSDLKGKYDQAYENRHNYQEKLMTISETKEMLERDFKQKLDELKTKSIKLCQICSSFNIAQEMKYLIKQLKIESDLLRNLETKFQAENLIKTLIKLTRSVEENQEKLRRNRPPMQIISSEQSTERKPTDINLLKTSDLIELYHNTINHSLLSSILNELHHRAQGKSTGPLLTSNEILIINKTLEKYNQKNLHELSYSYRQLQQQIHAIIQSDILRLVEVNSELLIENFIVQTLLDEKEKNINTKQGIVPETQRSIPPSMVNSFPKPVHPTPYPKIESMPSQTKSSNINSISLGFSGLISPPYPSPNASSPMPALPPDFSPNLRHKTHDYPCDLQDTKSSTSSIGYQDFTHMPMPIIMNKTQRSNNLRNSNVDYPSSEHSSQPDVIPTLNMFNTEDQFLFDPSKSLLNKESFRSLNNTRLLSMYTDACIKKNESQASVFHEELARRCYGDYSILIDENKDLFQEKIQINQMKTIGELMIAQGAIKRKIRGYLKNDDVTLINNIPLELIVEANAITHLIASKNTNVEEC